MVTTRHLSLPDRYLQVRQRTERLAAPLGPEDQCLQSMPDCSPVKWHRAHTTWFFETFLLVPQGRPRFHPGYDYLFNSYYEALGPRHERPRRGLLSRPTVDEVTAWRRAVDGRMVELLQQLTPPALEALAPLVELGLAHEEQHQELLLTDILHAFSCNPLKPAYLPAPEGRAGSGAGPMAAGDGAPASRAIPAGNGDRPVPAAQRPMGWCSHAGGLVELGAAQGAGFTFDNEQPRHRTWLAPYQLADRTVSVGEVKAFIQEGGYRTPSLWLSEGLEWVRREGVVAPLHARVEGGSYVTFGLYGEREAGDDEPAVHLSFYEAEALARFLGARLPIEAEWEHAATGAPVDGHFLEQGPLVPQAARDAEPGLRQLFGTAWEWTRSSYEPYPGFVASPGAVGEYNGKFMVNQRVLRGGSLLTPPGHVRATYRNFWHPHVRFQLTGLRLARDG